MSTTDVFRRGLKEIDQLDPHNGVAFIEELKKVSPDFAEHFVEFAFGKIYSRSVLDTKVKELVAITSLVAIGHCQSHLKLRIAGAARAGCTREEVMEVIIQSTVFIGFMRAVSALKLVRDVFDHQTKSPSQGDSC